MTKQTIALLTCLLLVIAAYGQEESSGETYTPTTTSYSYESPSSSSVSSSSGLSRKFGAGYDEGLAARFFFNDRMGVQASLHLEYLGGYDETSNTLALGEINNLKEPETHVGFGAAFLFNLFSHDKVLVDAMGQVIVYHLDGGREDDEGDRMLGFLRIAACPEFIVAERLGFGLKVGLEVVYTGETELRDAPYDPNSPVLSTNDETTDIRFFGPKNPFEGPVLGFSVFYYF
jgi:hypothetical protein